MTRPLFSLALVALLAAPAAGQGLPSGFTDPEYFAVTGVAEDDVLNVRAAPSGASEIIGSLAPGQAPVEVISRQGNWGEVIASEGNGYVSMTYLTPIDMPRIGGSGIPEGLRCLGTEPFWSLDFGKGELTLDSVATETETSYALSHAAPFMGRPFSDFAIGQAGGDMLTASVVREYCSDGMSNRNYPMSVRVIGAGPGDPQGYEGCCLVPGW